MGQVGWGELVYMWGELVEMWGELSEASWHKNGASWLGRVGFGAHRLALFRVTDLLTSHKINNISCRFNKHITCIIIIVDIWLVCCLFNQSMWCWCTYSIPT